MFLYVDQLEKQLDKEEFQEIGSMASFKVLETQFQMFIKSRIYLDDEYVVMTRNYFLQYTQLAIPEFLDTLIQHMESVKMLIDERAQHKREYDSWVNERQIQTTEGKVDSCKALDSSLVDTESSGTTLKEQDTSSSSGNDAHADDADIRPIYDEEPMAENAEQCHDTCPLPAKLTNNQTTKLSNQSLESKNIWKPTLQPRRNQSVVSTNAFKSERPRFSKQRFASQVNVNNDLSKPVTTHYLSKERESAVAKPHHMIAPGSSRYSSNDMLHKHYLEEAKKKTQESSRNSKPSVMPSARSQSTTNGSKPKSKINNQKSKNWPATKSSCVTIKTVPIAEHFRNSIGLKWIPTRKIFTSSTTKVDSEPTNGSNDDITNKYECEQTLDVSACTLNLSAGTSFNPKKEGLRVCSELGIHDHNNEQSSSKLVPKVVPPADKTATSRQELELLFHHHITMLRSTCAVCLLRGCESKSDSHI
ncbi:hypothetical protein Tco_0543650 [Tanacetum coccineum]